ncbi:lipopolysaccharide biosynthesis protein [Thermodesulfobacteriota bacterium]
MNRVEVDRAVFFGVLSKVWSIVAGPVTLILIATKFSPELQGYYYTFGSILALQVFVELGLGSIIIQFASHEWAKLSIGEARQITGDSDALSRLTSLAKIITKWYFFGSIFLIFGLGIGGFIFFSSQSTVSFNWQNPWMILCLIAGLNLMLVPIWSLLEGCNMVTDIYTYRFISGISSSFSCWIAIYLDAKLWTAVIVSLVSLLYGILFLFFRFKTFLKNLFFTTPTGARIKWQQEILPLQWRIALSWLSGYFVFNFFTPVLFKYHGPVTAGQMGMTWGLVAALSSIASSWLNPKAPRFGILIAQGDYKKLDILFWRLTKVVVIIAIIGASVIWSLVFILHSLHHPFAIRVLSPLPTSLFLLATIISISTLSFSLYLRAHKKEPLLAVSVISGLLIAISNLILGKHFGATGMAWGYLLVNVLIFPFVILIWSHCRRHWHS